HIGIGRPERHRARHQEESQPSVPAGQKVSRLARPFAALTTVSAMLGAGAALAFRRLSQPPQPST
ncbi:MAG TPA: hypothetical protein VF812_00070, partial [Ktedonobacterales bacterium]